MGLYRSQRGEKDIETEWKYLRHNNTGSTIKATVNCLYSCYCISEPSSYLHGNYESSSHAQRVESMIHFLIELYRNWREDSETEWRCHYKSETKHTKTGGTKRVSVQFFLWCSLLHICAPPLPAWRSYDSYIWKFMIAPAMQGDCSTVVMHFLTELCRNWREWKWVYVSEQNKRRHKYGGAKE